MVDVLLSGGSPSRPRRSDAERNRDRVLRVARQHIGKHGMQSLTMDLLAEKAGVGKGTLYRGFGSRGGLAEALLDDAERDLQERILTGPAPLGPGGHASPGSRVAAFVRAYVELLDANAELIVETERGSPGARYHNGAYAFWHTHVAGLLRLDDEDEPHLRADLLLATLAADLFQHLRENDVSLERIADAIVAEHAWDLRLVARGPAGRHR